MTPRRKAWLIAGAVALIPLGGVGIVLEAWLAAPAYLRRERARVESAIALLRVSEANLTVPYIHHDQVNMAKASPGDGDTEYGLDFVARFLNVPERLVKEWDFHDLSGVFKSQMDGFSVLQEYVRSADLSREHLNKVAAILDRVDCGTDALAQAYLFTDLRFRKAILNELEEAPGGRRPEWLGSHLDPNWRNFYSAPVAASQLLGRMDGYLAGVHARLGLRGEGRRKALKEWMIRCFQDLGPPLSDTFFTATQEDLRLEAQATINLQLARAAVAIARYQLDHGSPPTTLEALVPAYLKAVPSNPDLDEPLEYKFDPIHSTVRARGGHGDADEELDFRWIVRLRDAGR